MGFFLEGIEGEFTTLGIGIWNVIWIAQLLRAVGSLIQMLSRRSFNRTLERDDMGDCYWFTLPAIIIGNIGIVKLTA